MQISKELLDYFEGDELAANVWLTKYALKDREGNILEKTPKDMHERIATELYRVESEFSNPLSYRDISDLLHKFKYFIPGGSAMNGIGNEYQITSLSNCFVIGNEADSYGGIMLSDQEQVQLMKRRGGVGHDLSHIRPKGSTVLNSALTSTGIVPFMERFSNSTREVAQDGRRGALMLSMHIKHPDIIDFIEAKTDLTKVTGANISVKIDDEFMQCLDEKKPYIQSFPIKDNTIKKVVSTSKIWNKLVQSNWKSAEPGILFWDNIINNSISDCYPEFKTISTNPCGEIPLSAYDSCRLGSINLVHFVFNPYTGLPHFDFTQLDIIVRQCIQLMDSMIELEMERIDSILFKIINDSEVFDVKRVENQLWNKIRNNAVRGRRIGLGITGLGDTLARMGLRYGKEAYHFIEELMKVKAKAEMEATIDLAISRGSFQAFDYELEKNSTYINSLLTSDYKEKWKKHGRRNISLSTIAPNGSISILTQTTSGIEPVFNIMYKRRKKVNKDSDKVKSYFVDKNGDSWEEYNVFHKGFLTWFKHAYSDTDTDIANLSDKEIMENIFPKSPYYRSTANEIDPFDSVDIQAICQKYTTHSISKTINLPKETTTSTIDKLYRYAHKSGCKGLTIYREGSRDGVLINNKPEEQEKLITRPKTLMSSVIRFTNNKEQWIGFLGLKDGKPYEIFTGKANEFQVPSYIDIGKIIKVKSAKGSRYDFTFIDKEGYTQIMKGLDRVFDRECWNTAKLISTTLRHGVPLTDVINIIEQLKFENDEEFVLTNWKNGVIRMLKKYIKDGEVAIGHTCDNKDCKSANLVYEEGCLKCMNCGTSKCG